MKLRRPIGLTRVMRDETDDEQGDNMYGGFGGCTKKDEGVYGTVARR